MESAISIFIAITIALLGAFVGFNIGLGTAKHKVCCVGENICESMQCE